MITTGDRNVLKIIGWFVFES